MTRGLWFALLCVVLAPGVALHAQAGAGAAGQEAEALRQQVLARWRARVRTELALTDQQAARLEQTENRYLAERRQIALQQRGVMSALRDQLDRGGNANADSVQQLLAARDADRAALLDLERRTDRELAAFLTPVQHARYQIMRQRLEERIQEMLRRRRARGMGP
ncbi:MAG TPA: hypothetical protein VLV45_09085 [Gemmatimonadales bacterium]|nr:hypothetical protein [Gemmatimonadales bacterium]